MTNPFHSNELLKSVSNYPVLKGDVAGHPFHGNQWVGGGMGTAFHRHLATAYQLHKQHEWASSPETIAMDGEANAAQRRANIARANRIGKAAVAHKAAAKAIQKGLENPTPTNITAAQTASEKAQTLAPTEDKSFGEKAQEHRDEAQRLTDLAKKTAEGGNYEGATELQVAAGLHNEAATANEAVTSLSDINGSYGVYGSAAYEADQRSGNAGSQTRMAERKLNN